MTLYRPFNASDTSWTAAGLAFGLFYGFMGVAWACIALLVEGVWIIMLGLLPMLLIQLAVIFGADWLMASWRPDPPSPSLPWLRYHAVNLGAAVGAGFCLLSLWLTGPILGGTP
jgi:hypothetical protein